METNREVQQLEDGVGPLYHRVYAVEFEASLESVQAAMARMQKELDLCSPSWLAKFEKIAGEEQKLREGDEYEVSLSAPWEAPVRVEKVTPMAFTLVTLAGHLEAGEIHFRVNERAQNLYRFEIESLARSKDRIVDFLYDKLPVARFAQTEMWTDYCQNFLKLVCEIERHEAPDVDVDVLTEKFNEKTNEWESVTKA